MGWETPTRGGVWTACTFPVDQVLCESLTITIYYSSHSTDGRTEAAGGDIFSPLLFPSLGTFHPRNAPFSLCGHLMEWDKGKALFPVLIPLPMFRGEYFGHLPSAASFFTFAILCCFLLTLPLSTLTHKPCDLALLLPQTLCLPLMFFL